MYGYSGMYGYGVQRMLATSSMVGAATAFRMGLGYYELMAERWPYLMGLAAETSAGPPVGGRAEAEFRDELLALAHDSSELYWRELRRGVDDLDAFTRPYEEHPRRGQRRPYRTHP
jgi:hypothetical protein